MTLDIGLSKIKAVDLVTERGAIVENAVILRTKKTMAGELARDAELSIQNEIRRSMFECINRFIPNN